MKKQNALGARVWFCAVFFGLVGQIAWIVENMYFATFAQDIFSNSGRGDLSYLVTTLMVIFSALTATVTTIISGALCDKAGKRKPFIAFGYIAWGITIMIFSAIPMSVSASNVVLVATLLVIFDCLMTIAGSTSNDAAFNAWVADNTKPENRGRLNSVLSILPVIAVVIVFVGLGGFYNSQAESNATFFIILGIIPIISGLIALFTLKDSNSIEKQSQLSASDLFYGFRPSVVKENKMLYICLLASCIIGISQQTFFSYLINFLSITLGLGGGFVIPMAVIIVMSAVMTAVAGIISDKIGRKKLYFPMLILAISGILSLWAVQFTQGFLRTFITYFGGTIMMAGILSLGGFLSSTFQDKIPNGFQGRYQGVRMCFTVLIPMVVGPIISLIIGLDAMGMNGDNFAPPYAIFLAAAIVAVLAIWPLAKIRREK